MGDADGQQNGQQAEEHSAGKRFFLLVLYTLETAFYDEKHLVHKHPDEYFKDVHLFNIHMGCLQGFIGCFPQGFQHVDQYLFCSGSIVIFDS